MLVIICIWYNYKRKWGDIMNNGYGQQIVSTKANTLYALSKVIKKSKIEKMYILPVAEFENNRENVLRDITETYVESR